MVSSRVGCTLERYLHCFLIVSSSAVMLTESHRNVCAPVMSSSKCHLVMTVKVSEWIFQQIICNLLSSSFQILKTLSLQTLTQLHISQAVVKSTGAVLVSIRRDKDMNSPT
jgi:hypothetical protein